jgi:hypothetical protein
MLRSSFVTLWSRTIQNESTPATSNRVTRQDYHKTRRCIRERQGMITQNLPWINY